MNISRHFTQANFEMSSLMDPRLLYLLLAIGLFILIIASLNYINLSTARAMSRSKDIIVAYFLLRVFGSHLKQKLTQ